jgi:predicted Zn-dependent protease
MRGGNAAEAERVFREDLRRHPGNGWALYGLMQALKAQGRVDDASAAEAEFRKAWGHATIVIGASAF